MVYVHIAFKKNRQTSESHFIGNVSPHTPPPPTSHSISTPFPLYVYGNVFCIELFINGY